MQPFLSARFARPVLAALLLIVLASPAAAQHYTQTNLVSNQAGQAISTDANVVNAWGIARSATSPWWVSDNPTGKATVHNSTTGATLLTITVPGAPTGMVFNGTAGFSVLGGAPARFLFASEDGTISAWNGGAQAQVVVTTAGAVYKGIAIATVDGNPKLYATNFHSGHVDVFDTNFQPVTRGKGSDNKSDNDNDNDDRFFLGRRRGLAPFNIQNIGDTMFVTFAKQDAAKHDEVDGPGLGLVGAFTPAGKLIAWFDQVNDLNAPWGLAMAPSEFGTFSHHLLVGQFGSGEILAFNPTSGEFAGKLLQPGGQPINIDGIWGIGFGNGGNAGPLNTLFFAAGPNGESNGLFGTLTTVSTDLVQGNSN